MGAPVGITLVAGIAVPAMIIGIPVWVGRKVREPVNSYDVGAKCTIFMCFLQLYAGLAKMEKKKRRRKMSNVDFCSDTAWMMVFPVDGISG